MKTHLTGRIPAVAAIAIAVAMLALGFLAALGVRSLVTGTASASPTAAPNPGHAWTELENHGTSGSDYWLGTTGSEALELHVNGARALRLEPDAESPNVIGGYSGNSVTGGVVGATVGGGGAGGSTNRVGEDYGTVGGGSSNTASGTVSTVGGGQSNTASAQYTTVGGGANNITTAQYATVGGGNTNVASNNYATVGGGAFNTASGQLATIAGGNNNAASAVYATVSGGEGNSASDQHATVGGGNANTASNNYATVGGGAVNTASGQLATIAGGNGNTATDDYSVVGGGYDNQAGDAAGTTADRPYATVSGGSGNTASGQNSTVGGGSGNTASDSVATVAGGDSNVASGLRATVPGGLLNVAAGDHSFAAGHRAKINALHDGAFLYADFMEFDFNSAAINEFAVRSTGGARFVTAIDGAGAPTAGVKLDPGDTAWEVLSDIDSKENFVTVSPENVLQRLSTLPIAEWNYKAQDDSVRHIGPAAQDFYDAFGLSDDERYISPIDTDGVALVAIQGLYELVQEKDAQIQALEERLGELEQGSGVSNAQGTGDDSSGLPTTWLLAGGLILVAGLSLQQARFARRRQ